MLSGVIALLAGFVFWLTFASMNVRAITSLKDFTNEIVGRIGLQAIGYFLINGVTVLGHHTLLPELQRIQRETPPPRDEAEATFRRIFSQHRLPESHGNGFFALIHLVGSLALHGGIFSAAVEGCTQFGQAPLLFVIGYFTLFAASVALWIYALRISLRMP